MFISRFFKFCFSLQPIIPTFLTEKRTKITYYDKTYFIFIATRIKCHVRSIFSQKFIKNFGNFKSIIKYSYFIGID